MRIWIVTMDDPVYTNNFIKNIIHNKKKEIIGITIARGNRLKINKHKSKLAYLTSLFLIMGIPYFFLLSFRTISYKLIKLINPNSKYTLAGYTKKMGIPVVYTDNPNSRDFCNMLKDKDLDIIINQSQFILKKRFLSIPKIGVLNRHNALLPHNRGRLTPFWVLYKQEKETGITIHFINDRIDDGDIIIQKSYIIPPKATFRQIVQKNYSIANKAIIEALDLLESNNFIFPIKNDYIESYNSIPSLQEALRFRIRDPLGIFKL